MNIWQECVDDSISLTHNFLPKHNFSAVRACLLANRCVYVCGWCVPEP